MIGRIRWQILVALIATLAIVLVLGSFVLSSAATAQPLQGRTYIEGVVGEARQLNPLAQGRSASQAERDIAALLFDGLTRIGPDGRVQPALAESWQISEDGRAYTFTLADRTWHDGVPVTTDDVVYTIRGVQNASFPGDPSLAALWRNVLVEQIDQRTIRFKLSSPFAPFLSAARLPILPSHLLRTLRPDQWARAPFSRQPIGTGAFRLQAIDAQQVLLVPAQADGRARLDNLLLRLYPTPDAALLALSRREVQSVATAAIAGRRAPDPLPRTERFVMPLGEYTVLAFNLQEQPLDDLQLRRALALGINRDLLITTVLGGQGRRLDTPVLPQTWAADRSAQLPAFRRSAAQQALGQLGLVDSNGDGWLDQEGQRFVLPLLIADTPEQAAIATEIQRQLRTIGVGITIQRVPASELSTDLAAHNFTLALHSWSNVGADPDAYALWHSSQVGGGANYAGLDDDQIDRLLEQGRATTDPAERQRIYGEFQRRWAELIPSLPLYQSVLVYDVDESITLPTSPPAITPSRADRFQALDRWVFPDR